jgi:hypothetical protein
MGNARSSTKRISKDNLTKDGLYGMEIVLDQPQEQEGFGCAMFEENDIKNNHMENRICRAIDRSIDFPATQGEDDIRQELRKSASSLKSAGSRRSSRRLSSEDAADLMTCTISGLDPIELLRLVQECAAEEEKEKAMIQQDARLSKQNPYAKGKGRSSCRRSRDSMNSVEA